MCTRVCTVIRTFIFMHAFSFYKRFSNQCNTIENETHAEKIIILNKHFTLDKIKLQLVYKVACIYARRNP